MNNGITNIAACFDALKPGVADDFRRTIGSLVEGLIEKHGENIRKLGNEWSRDGNLYRAIGRTFIMWDGRRAVGVDHDLLDKKAKQYADDQIDAFVMKLTRKLADLDSPTVNGINPSSFEFYITGSLRGERVRVQQSRIINMSAKGTPYHQWPALIYVNGKKVSEAEFKRMAA